MEGYTIGQLATAAGVPTSTIRFYERQGLVKPDFRTGGNYRGYAATTLQRLKFIRSAQATGLNLHDIESLLRLTFSSDPPCEEVLNLMRKRLEEIRQRVKELRHVEKVLAKSLNGCCKGNGPDICDDICRINGCDPADCKPAKKKIRASA
ncbi:MAG TPA: MerR family transcriptional regulator [Humisphaera sp.]|nr:MerR family transcriptional regulator [Humisphaera sp.]